MVPSKEQFLKLSKKGNLIPVYRSIPIGSHTPAEVFRAIDRGGYSYLLESIEGPEKLARYSFMGSRPRIVLKSKGRRISISSNGRMRHFAARRDPLSEIKKILGRFKFVPNGGLPRFCGGLVGYIGYDMVRFFERLPDKNKDDLKLPDSIFLLAEDMIIFDHKKGRINIVSNANVDGGAEAAYDRACEKIELMIRKIHLSKVLSFSSPSLPSLRLGLRGTGKCQLSRERKKKRPKLKSNFTKSQFMKRVRRAKAYIRKGDVIQTVLSQRFQREVKCGALEIYNALRELNPSPYMYYLKLGELQIIGSSPEIMVRCERQTVELRPIAGTRKRGRDAAEERHLRKELLSDPKERAEHIMLVDLGRNDIGRVCDKGSVRISEFMSIEKYSHVMHIVSGCVGRLSKDKESYDLIRASFPAGTVTGAPKVRAMEIIDELENRRRGPYAGCIGYFSFSGNLDTCIIIRTILIKKGSAYIQAGAGIVADSKPEREYLETVNKAKGMVRAIEIAEGCATSYGGQGRRR